MHYDHVHAHFFTWNKILLPQEDYELMKSERFSFHRCPVFIITAYFCLLHLNIATLDTVAIFEEFKRASFWIFTKQVWTSCCMTSCLPHITSVLNVLKCTDFPLDPLTSCQSEISLLVSCFWSKLSPSFLNPFLWCLKS